MYLGDGYISDQGRGVFRLRISCDAAYPGVILECANAVDALFPGQRAGLYLRRDCACLDVSLYSKHWPCFIPQYGVGRKHDRAIALTDWQRDIVMAEPQAFLRGLIHSDGTRYVARQRSERRTYEWPRYCFSNRSDDIKQLFCETCDLLGIPWRRAGSKHVYVNRREGVAMLDGFVGPKG